MALKVLKERILQDGRLMEGGILRVDSFVNHQMDPILMKQAATEFMRRFADLSAGRAVYTHEFSEIVDKYRKTVIKNDFINLCENATNE